jgi:hypothetical protein
VQKRTGTEVETNPVIVFTRLGILWLTQSIQAHLFLNHFSLSDN